MGIFNMSSIYTQTDLYLSYQIWQYTHGTGIILGGKFAIPTHCWGAQGLCTICVRSYRHRRKESLYGFNCSRFIRNHCLGVVLRRCGEISAIETRK